MSAAASGASVGSGGSINLEGGGARRRRTARRRSRRNQKSHRHRAAL
jgi:hypothetical protein